MIGRKQEKTYYGGAITELEYLGYYKEVIRLLSGMLAGEKYEENLSIEECRIAIDNLLEDY